MSKFEEYANKYEHVKMERRDGILQFTLHTNGGPVIWDFQAHSDTAHALGDVARDRDNKVIILTGSGDNFIAEHEFGDADKIPAAMWDHVITDAKYLIMNHLDVEAPMIAAVNGPALIHAELALLCDIVLASETAVFQDLPHFPSGLVPGDGVHVVFPLLLGANRGRYFLLMGEKIDAKEAKHLGLVGEVLAPDKLLARAWEVAHHLLQRPPLGSLTRPPNRLVSADQIDPADRRDFSYDALQRRTFAAEVLESPIAIQATPMWETAESRLRGSSIGPNLGDA